MTKFRRGGGSIRPARLFNKDSGYLSPEDKKLISYFFEHIGEDSQRIQHPVATTETGIDELGVEQVDMTMEDEEKISDVEDGDEVTGIESPEASSRHKSTRLKEIQNRASEAKERQQQSLEDSIAPVGNATPTSLGLAAAKVGRAGAKVVSETRATSMYGEPTPYQPFELEAPMDFSPY